MSEKLNSTTLEPRAGRDPREHLFYQLRPKANKHRVESRIHISLVLLQGAINLILYNEGYKETCNTLNIGPQEYFRCLGFLYRTEISQVPYTVDSHGSRC